MGLRLALSKEQREAQKAVALGYVEAAIEKVRLPQLWQRKLDWPFEVIDESPNWKRLSFGISTGDFSHGVVVWAEIMGFRCSHFHPITLKDAVNEQGLLGLLHDLAEEAKILIPRENEAYEETA